MSPRSQLRLVVLLGLLAPVWWTWSMSRLSYGMYVASGSPARPSLGLLWTSVYVPACILGFLAGAAASVLSRESPLRGWVIFAVSLLVGAAIQSVLINGSLSDSLAVFLGSYGNLLFWAGSLLWPIAAHIRRANRPD